MSCSKHGARPGLMCCLLLLLSSASTAFTGLSKAELSTGRWKSWLCLFLIEHRSFKGLASSLGNLTVTLQELQGIASSHRSWKGPCSSLPQLLAKQLHLPMHPARWVGPQLMCLNWGGHTRRWWAAEPGTGRCRDSPALHSDKVTRTACLEGHLEAPS